MVTSFRLFVDRRRFPTDDATETSAVDVATVLVADTASRLLLGNLTSLNDVTETEEKYKSLQAQLCQSDVIDQVSSAFLPLSCKATERSPQGLLV